MADVNVISVLDTLESSAKIIHNFAEQLTRWKQVSDRLCDIHEGLNAARITLEMWRRKYAIHDRRPALYMHVLFGRLGWEKIQQTLGNIEVNSAAITQDVNGIVKCSKRFRPRNVTQEQLNADDDSLVRVCIQRIERNTSWARKFKYSVLAKAGNLQVELERLNCKLTILERVADAYLEREHGHVFHHINRLPGRRMILRDRDPRLDTIQRKLLEAISAQKDAEFLYRASTPSHRIHIGLSVPQIHKRDFAFLLSLQSQSHEILAHPVKFKGISERDRNIFQPNISSAIPALLASPQDTCNMLPPSAPLSAGFQVSIPPSNILADLEYKDPLNTLITNQNSFLGQQVLYPQDQVAIACGIVQACFRLLGTEWLQFMDCRNIRWRRSVDGNHWTTMMAAIPTDSSITRALDQVLRMGGGPLKLKQMQILRIGLLLTEVALKTPITYIQLSPSSSSSSQYFNPLIFIAELSPEPLDPVGVAAEVETRTNVLLGNIVFFCLSILQDWGRSGEREVEMGYHKDVLREAEELEKVVRAERRRISMPGMPF